MVILSVTEKEYLTILENGLGANRKWLLATILSGTSLTILDVSKINVGLPFIRSDLHASPTALQLIVAGYALSYGLSLVPAGRLGDIGMRNRLFLSGILIFTLASIACATSQNAKFLVTMRLVQGIGAGVLMPQVISIIQHAFSPASRSKIFGLLGATIGISAAIGPAIGAFLISIGGSQFGWRLTFWMNVPLGMFVFLMALRNLPRKQSLHVRLINLDIIGVILLGTAIFLFLFPFLFRDLNLPFPKGPIFTLATASILLIFLYWEKHYTKAGKLALIDFKLFNIPSFRNGILVALFFYAGSPALFLVITLYLQESHGVSVLAVGLVTLPSALLAAVVSWRVGYLINRHRFKLVTWGLVVTGISYVLVIMVSNVADSKNVALLLSIVLLLSAIGSGMVMATNQSLTLEHVKVSNGGIAGSIAQLSQRVGITVGLAVASSTYLAKTLPITTSNRKLITDMIFNGGFQSAVIILTGFILMALIVSIPDLVNDRKGTNDKS